MYLEAASIVPERIQYHPAGPPPGSGDPTSAQLPLGADWRDPITGREGFRLPGNFRIGRLGQHDETRGLLSPVSIYTIFGPKV